MEIDEYIDDFLNRIPISELKDDEITHVYKVSPDSTYLHENLDNLPGNVEIFTLPVTTSLYNCKFNLENIYNYFPLSYTDIVSIQTNTLIRTIIPTKKILKSDTEIANFKHQFSIVMSIYTSKEKKERKDVNIKLFENDAIQITGLMTIYQCNYAVNKIINLLRGEKGFFFKKGTNTLSKFGHVDTEFRTVKFINNNDGGDDIYITPVKISTINVIYNYKSHVNRSKVFYKLQELKLKGRIPSNVNIIYQSDITSPVKITILTEDNMRLVLFVFASGKISILACKHRNHVIKAFEFIHEILEENYYSIINKSLLDAIANMPEIKDLLDMKALAKLSIK